METLVAVGYYKDQYQYYDGRNRGHGSTHYDMFGSAPAANFVGVNCRMYESSGVGLLPTPTKSTPVMKKAVFPASVSPKTPSPFVNENTKSLKRNGKSSAIGIPVKINFENEVRFNFSERWAGPAYSNSPPPSSLPLPNFSMKPRRTVSLELPSTAYDIELHAFAKSAPSSPTRGRSPSPGDVFDHTDSATKTLRRILNLDFGDA